MTTKARATVDDLYKVADAKAEIVGGELVLMSPAGSRPGRASFNIASSLRRERPGHQGYAFGDNVGFLVNLPNRGSFNPDAAGSLEASIA